MDHVGEGKVVVMPLFVAITTEMEIAFSRGRSVPRAACGVAMLTLLRLPF
jgi:hypothetical protein